MASIVMVAMLTLLRPVLAGAIVDWAYDSPSALALPFVKDLVKEDLGTKLTTAPSTDSTKVEFVVAQGETAAGIATRLARTASCSTPGRSCSRPSTGTSRTSSRAARSS